MVIFGLVTKSYSHKESLLCLLNLLDEAILGKKENTDGVAAKNAGFSATLLSGKEETSVIFIVVISKVGFIVGEVSLGSMTSSTKSIGLDATLRCLKGKKSS